MGAAQDPKMVIHTLDTLGDGATQLITTHLSIGRLMNDSESLTTHGVVQHSNQLSGDTSRGFAEVSHMGLYRTPFWITIRSRGGR